MYFTLNIKALEKDFTKKKLLIAHYMRVFVKVITPSFTVVYERNFP